jgi:3-hydroxy-9,10-secoandrosta-1,3,5(10)-triene-9,17-dione monooxygenase
MKAHSMTSLVPARRAEAAPPADHDALLDRARALEPVFAERAAAAEELRRLPPASEADLHASGLYRMLQPRRFGGSELGYDALITIGAAIARGCASTAWNLTNLASHHWMLAMFPPEAQRRLWDQDPDVLIASSFVFPAARVTRAKGGYLISGRWPFSSGVDPSTWNMLAGVVREPGEAPDHRIFLVPQSDYAILDTWRVSGLKATGSNDVAIEEAFVPDEMTVSVKDLKGGPTPGAALNPEPLYRLPVFALFPAILSGVALGNAEAALDDYVSQTTARSSRYTGVKLAELQSTHIRIGAAAARVATSRRVMLDLTRQAMAEAEAGRIPGIAAKLACRRDLAFATELATQTVDQVNAASGAGGLYAAGALQRRFRDAHAIMAHIAFNMDASAAAYGRVAIGQETDNEVV